MARLDFLIFFSLTKPNSYNLRLSFLNSSKGCMKTPRLDTPPPDGPRQFTALTDDQFCAWSTRSRTGHRNHCGYGNSLATSTPTFDIGKDITHRNSPYETS